GADLLRGRAVGGRLDYHRDSRLAGELGTLPRRDADASHERRHRRRLSHAPAGDELHRPQPADRLRRDAIALDRATYKALNVFEALSAMEGAAQTHARALRGNDRRAARGD